MAQRSLHINVQLFEYRQMSRLSFLYLRAFAQLSEVSCPYTGESVFVPCPVRWSICSAAFFVGSLFAKFSVWSFSDLPGPLKPVLRAGWGSNSSREVPSHLIYSLPWFEPLLWRGRFTSSLFLRWGCREFLLYVSGGVNAHHTPPLHRPLALSSVLCSERVGTSTLAFTLFSKCLRQKPVSVLWVPTFTWFLVSDYFLLSWKHIDALKMCDCFFSVVAFYFAFLVVFSFWCSQGIQPATLLGKELEPQTLRCGC